MSIKGKIAVLFKKSELNININVVDQVIKKNGNPNWFSYIIKERTSRYEIIQSCNWIAWNIKSDEFILEAGCGIGSNLFWLAQNGFINLSGCDIDGNLIKSATELSNNFSSKFHFWKDNALNPSILWNRKYKVVFALNWLYLCEEFEIGNFLSIIKQYIEPNGYLIIDLIDKSYNTVSKNQYLTSDWAKPENERKTIEYKKRFSENDVRKSASINNYKIKKIFVDDQIIPRKTYILKTI